MVMRSELEKRELEVVCQQVLLPDASVYSVQWLDLPACHWSELSSSRLLEGYLKSVRRTTWQLIRPTLTGQGVEFRLLATSLSLLSFLPPDCVSEEGGHALYLHICGGLLVQAGEGDRGSFSLHCAAREGGLRVTLQLSGFCPLLLGSANPSPLRKLFYRFTQSYLHKVVTVGYLSRLHRDLTGMRTRTQVREAPAS